MTILIVSLLAQAAPARNVAHDETRAIELRLVVASGERHDACVVTFPEDGLDSIVASWSEGDLSLERRGANLFVKLLRRVEGDLHVIGASGVLYRLRIVAVEADGDARVRITRPAADARPPAPTLDLVRAMRRGEVPDGVAVRASGAAIARTGQAEWTCLYVYEATSRLGYVLEVKNMGEAALRVDPSRFVSDDLLCVGARELSVPAGGSTRVYLVLRR